MEDQALTLKQKRLAAIRDGIARDTYLTIDQVMAYLGVSRATVEAYPIEILPYWDATPTSTRTRRRYNPSDVAAAPTRIRRWAEARALGRGDAYLQTLREELHAREERVLTQAVELRIA
jgi:hypothetical protein